MGSRCWTPCASASPPRTTSSSAWSASTSRLRSLNSSGFEALKTKNELNLQFHALVLRLSNNQRAHAAYDDYVKELHLFRRKYFNAPGNMRRSNIEHRQIYEAIVKGNPSKAKTVAERHVLTGRQRLLSTLET